MTNQEIIATWNARVKAAEDGGMNRQQAVLSVARNDSNLQLEYTRAFNEDYRERRQAVEDAKQRLNQLAR